jgi:hypothetical protein
MKIEDQICTLDQAKKLKSFGLVQESLWYYRVEKAYPDNYTPIITKNEWPKPIDEPAFEFYSAFNTSELGVALPQKVYKNNEWYFFQAWPHHVLYRSNDKQDVAHIVFNEYQPVINTEARGRAELLITLFEIEIEQGKYFLEEMNKYLTGELK